MIIVPVLKKWLMFLSVQHIHWQARQWKRGKYGCSDVTLLPDEVVKSFLETKAPQEIWRERGRKRLCFWQTTQECGGPQLLLNRLVLSHPPLLFHCSSIQTSLLLSSITSERASEPRSLESHAATQSSSGLGQQRCKLAEAGDVPALCSLF